eukprot:scaffold6861_cov248-Ochromonas_danica.AAC.12
MGGSRNVLKLLMQPDILLALPVKMVKCVLDVIIFLLHRQPYDIIRFQFNDMIPTSSESPVVVKLLMRLLEIMSKDSRMLSLTKRVIHLIGITASVGISVQDMKKFMMFLRSPSSISLSILQALNTMIKVDIGHIKASPRSFFSFGGPGAGIHVHIPSFPFQREYQFMTWFRVENFDSDASNDNQHKAQQHHSMGHHHGAKAFNSNHESAQHLFLWQNPSHKGLDVYLENNNLMVAVSNHSKAEPTIIKITGQPLRKGVWYHLSVRHSKPRVALFSSDELSISLDQIVVYQDVVRFPNLGNLIDTEFHVGLNFDGQMSPIYLFQEALSPVAMEALICMDGQLESDLLESNLININFNHVAGDLLSSVTSPDRKQHGILEKLTMAFHPKRCFGQFVLDIHSGRHARMSNITQPWHMINPRDLLSTMGGVNCLLPLFPRLLVENENLSINNASHNSSMYSIELTPIAGSKRLSGDRESIEALGYGLGTSMVNTGDDGYASTYLDYTVIQSFRSRNEEFQGDGSISLLFNILAKCIHNHRPHQLEILQFGAIELIEYAISCVPPEIMLAEGEKAVLALLQLKSSSASLPQLELRVAKLLLCNIALWSGASFAFLSSLLPLMLAAIKAQSETFLRLLGIKPFLDALDIFGNFEYSDGEVSVPTSPQTDGIVPARAQESERSTDKGTENNNSNVQSVSKLAISQPAATTSLFTSDNVVSTVDSTETSVSPVAISSNKGLTTSIPPIVTFSRSSTAASDALSPTEASSVSLSNQVTGRKGVKFWAEDSVSSNGLTPSKIKTPRSGNQKAHKMRKLKSFKMALSEAMYEEEEEETVVSPSGGKPVSGSAPLEAISEADCKDGRGEDAEKVITFITRDVDTSLPLSVDTNSEFSPRRLEAHGSDLSNHSLSDLRLMDMESADKAVVDSPQTPQTNNQRKQLREHLLQMVLTLILQGGGERELAPLVEYMASCKDKIVLNEVTQALLYLIVEGSSKMINALILACSGTEEFASFVMVYLIHQENEELRCSGIHLLTQFYLRVDQATPYALNLSMKKRKNSTLAKAINTWTQSYSTGLQRLQICGGLALLCEVISSHCRFSSEQTYSALLELLMTKPGGGVDPRDFSQSQPLMFSSMTSGRSSRMPTLATALPSDLPLFVGVKQVKTAIYYLMLDRVHDDSFDLINPIVLPIFFDLVPKLPVFVQEMIYTDFLTILKHSSAFRQAFVNCPSWHLCMFGLVSQLTSNEEAVSPPRSFHTVDISAELERWTGIDVEVPPLQAEEKKRLRGRSASTLLRAWNNSNASEALDRSNNNDSVHNSGRSVVIRTSPKLDGERDSLSQFDLWFDLGMKVYSTLLLHALENKHGWKELDRCMALSISNEGYSVAQTILSHLLNEMTFKMRPKYKELQKLAKSSNTVDKEVATDKLENFLSIMLTASHVALYDQQCVCGRINHFAVCKLRVHIFNALARKTSQKKNELLKTVDTGSDLYSSTKSSDDINNLTPGEIRALLEETEIQLQARIDDYKLAAKDGTSLYDPDSAELTNVEEFVDFFYYWQDIGQPPNSSTVAFPNGFAVNTQSLPNSSSNSTINQTVQTNPYKSIEELLHPLGRVHDTVMGKLTIILQTLRLFDIIFWPHSDATVRNTDMLRFSKDIPSSPANTYHKQSSQQQQQQQDDSNRIQMTMYSAVMRMGLYCLNTLLPTTYLAVLNIKRVKALIGSIDRISTYNTPTHDWLLATVATITLHLQRLIMIIEPAFNIIGIHDVNLKVRTVGPWSDSYDDYDRLTTDDASSIFEALEDKEKLKKLSNYFNSTPGRNLVRNIRASLYLLIDAFENHHSKLSNSLEERSYRSLWILIEQIKADALSARDGGLTMPSSSSPATIPVFASSPTAPFASAAVGRSTSKAMSTRLDDAVDAAGDIFEAPSFSPLASLTSFKHRSFSVYSESSCDQASNHEPNNNYLDSNSQDVPLATLTYENFVEDSFTGHDLVLMLKWLRYPYFSSNILRSIRVIQALDALDFLEDRSVSRFAKANLAYRQEVENHRDVAIKSVEEMTELKELSREVCEMMIERADNRQHLVRLSESIKMKNIAAKWYDCLQSYEADWSLWTIDPSTPNTPYHPNPGVAYFELGKHRDGKFRNMLLTKLPEPIGHLEAAYFDSKAKDQLTFELSQQQQQQGEGNVLASSSSHTSTKERALSLGKDDLNSNSMDSNPGTVKPFKMLALTNTSNLRSGLSKDGRDPSTAVTNPWDDEGAEEEEYSNIAAGDLSSSSTSVAGSSSAYSSAVRLSSSDGGQSQLLGGIADVTKIFSSFQTNEKRPTWTLVFNWSIDERVLCLMEVTQITLSNSIVGTICLTNKCIYFHYRKAYETYSNPHKSSGFQALKPFVDQRYYLDRLIEAYSRRYLLKNCAIELFFLDHTELFLAFNSLSDLQKFFKILKNQNLPLLTTPKYLNPKVVFKHSSYTELWKRRLISNFDYLIHLNIIAGRSYSDITQYPIFPWVIADYRSPSIDTTNRDIYRNLTLPMGALNPTRLQEFLDRYHTFDDENIPKFMFGSHYSSAGIVLYYLVRQEPYTSLAIALQNGRFDCPDRMFFNMEKTWIGCNSSMSDVKEMIPELYYNPNVFLNSNQLPLGELQEGGEVADVVLPPWTGGSAYEFVRIHREALESDYVSEHLHAWIDLIFGYKQTGPAAVQARNVFYYLTYENAINIDSIEDQLEKEAAKVSVCLH